MTRKIRRKEFKGAGKLLHPRPVAADHSEADREFLRSGRNGAREIGDDEAFCAFRDIGKRQHPARCEQLRG